MPITKDGKILSHRTYETFIGCDNPDLIEKVRTVLENAYRENPEIEVVSSLNGHGKTLIQVQSVEVYDTGWTMIPHTGTPDRQSA